MLLLRSHSHGVKEDGLAELIGTDWASGLIDMPNTKKDSFGPCVEWFPGEDLHLDVDFCRLDRLQDLPDSEEMIQWTQLY